MGVITVLQLVVAGDVKALPHSAGLDVRACRGLRREHRGEEAEGENCDNLRARQKGRGGATVGCFEVDEVGFDGFHQAICHSFADMKTIPAGRAAFRRQNRLLWGRRGGGVGGRTAAQHAACCSWDGPSAHQLPPCRNTSEIQL